MNIKKKLENISKNSNVESRIKSHPELQILGQKIKSQGI